MGATENFRDQFTMPKDLPAAEDKIKKDVKEKTGISVIEEITYI